MTTTQTLRDCKHCPRTITATDDAARALGWRWYSGPTLGGGHLTDVVCPVCSGATEPPPAGPEWAAGCDTCHWEYEPDTDDDRLLDAKQAIRVAEDHECEPSVWVRQPDEETTRHPWEFDKDGNLRKPRIKATAGAS